MKNSLAIGTAIITLSQLGNQAYAVTERITGRPNILIILADDLGYGDVQCYNPDRGRIPTPNIDRLALQGMRFTDGHSSSGVCSPSRYSLLTGRYHWRTRLQSGIVGPFGEPLIAPTRPNIAGLAKQHGYITACIGKWHLGWNWPVDSTQRKQLLQTTGNQDKVDETNLTHYQALWSEIFSKPIAGGPIARGFDYYFGTDVPNWPPFCFIENDRTVGIPSELLPAEKLLNNLASVPGPALKEWRLEQVLPALEGTPALRMGQWKLILGPASVWFSKVPDDNTVKLYNLNEDPGESKNLVAQHQKRVERMMARLEEIIADGCTTPGIVQKNDVEVHRYPDSKK